MSLNDIKYVGVNDLKLDMFEGQYIVPDGMAYNSYAILDEKTAVMDSVEIDFFDEWTKKIDKALDGKKLDYLVIQHMEPDHSSSIKIFMDKYQDVTIVSSQKAFAMMKNFFGEEFENRRIVVKEGDKLELGKHVLNFIGAPMIHWPEVIMTYDSYAKVLFSADAFGKFGAVKGDESDYDDWACESRRYYFGIVGKYGVQVQNVLKKIANFEIEEICSLHGPILKDNLGYYLNLYNIWSSYGVETEGVAIFYTSVYGHTKVAVEKLKEKLVELGCKKVVVADLAREDMAECVEDAFRYGKIVLATTTYNNDIFPFMRTFIEHLTERFYQNKTIGLIENGSWAPQAAKIMTSMFEGSKNITLCENSVKILSAINDTNIEQINALANELMK